ncbi:hypothetical protein [Mycolicibacterium bacteremicum]|uniref:hypothetical protein n=1 Tax=Mycolicibacterium bacteremicum TaxID=564198 RepID=UPI0026EEDF5B|nr:hypothetical protein [Mycolicibacterium bacteremicum]
MKPLSLRIAVLGVTATALTAGLVGCSSSTTVAASPGGDAFSACLTEHDIPAPPQGGQDGPPPEGAPAGPPPSGPPPHAAGEAPPAPPGIDQETWAQAHQACASLAPEPPAR